MEEELVAVFECPICLTYMMPPFRQCTQGHCFCIDCFNSIPRFGICRDSKENVRCLILEQMQASLTFPCKFKDEGTFHISCFVCGGLSLGLGNSF
ncbi:hypothetical protein JTB14_018304 [Gonioctena quinquepunctata]|nr:hypothetical protein JTB14_018304 [Gonioctena quinquepunctata]